MNGEPWYDYLAFPIAPAVLVVQICGIFLSRRRTRWILALACPATLLTMMLYVWNVDLEPEEGVNIGAGVMTLWFAVSLLVLAVALIREGAGALRERFFTRRDEKRR